MDPQASPKNEHSKNKNKGDTEDSLWRHSVKLPAAMHLPATPLDARLTRDLTPLVVVDTDPGVDDIFALMLLLNPAVPVRLLAITATYGNAVLEDTFLNIHAALLAAGNLSVPVYKGAEGPLLPGEDFRDNFFGPDGLYGKGKRWRPPYPVPVPKENAAEALVRLVKEHPGEVAVLTLGPLTNLATALQLYPALGTSLRHLIILGGNKRGVGNVTPTGEFNMYVDPEAASSVLQRVQCPITIVPWETAVESSISQEVFLRAIEGSPFLTDISEDNLRYHRDVLGVDVINLGDFFAASILANPEIVLECETLPGAVETCGTLTRGTLVLDRRPVPTDTPKQFVNLTLVDMLDTERLENMVRMLVW